MRNLVHEIDSEPPDSIDTVLHWNITYLAECTQSNAYEGKKIMRI